MALPDEYRLVGDPAALERAGLLVAEGRIVVERLLAESRFSIHSIAVTPAAAGALERVLELVASRPPVFVCGTDELHAITGFNFHRGCVALARRPPLSTMPDPESAARLLALEGVGNPDNVGGLFRTALALGVDAVLLDPASGDPFYRKAIRTSMAATLRLPFGRLAAWPDGLEPVRRAGFEIAALTPAADAIAIDDFARAAHPRLLIAVGSEGAGLGTALMQYADARVKIPIDGRADSLNVVVAAGIALATLRC